MAISVTDPITPAWNRMVGMLFRPFDARKWFTLGFCAFLAMLGEGGGSGNIGNPGGGGGGGGRGTGRGGGASGASYTFDMVLDDVKRFVLNNAWWIVPAVIALLALVVVLTWVRSRGKFMFLEGVAYDRAAVVEPWKRLRPLGNAFFRFQLLLIALAFVTVAAVIVFAFVVALPDIRADRFGGGALTAILVGGIALLVFSIVFGVIQAIAEDFLVPLMYLRGTGVGPAWREFRLGILKGNAGSIVVYFLMRIVLGLAAGVVMAAGMCVTCCIAALPYLSSVIFLPVFVFVRSYSLYFLKQFGPQYALVVELPPAPPPGGFPVNMAPPPAQPS